MRILYAVQATGNGHLSRANAILPRIKQVANVDVLVSGTEAEVTLDLPIQYQLHGLSFVFGKKGGIDYAKTFRRMKSKRFLREIREVPVESYDVVINDFEPVTAWACKLRGVPCIGLSHQSAVIHPLSPKPRKTDLLASWILQYYAPVQRAFGFHFEGYAPGMFTPVIRPEIRAARVTHESHITVYLPAYADDRLIEYFQYFKETEWHIFSKRCSIAYRVKNCWIQPVNSSRFTDSLVRSHGIICGAGFETPAEALFLGKKMIAIPMKGQYEQQCNAAALAQLGVPVIKSLKKKHRTTIAEWLSHGTPLQINFPDQLDEITQAVLTAQPLLATADELLPPRPSEVEQSVFIPA
jgi:uncharacterized protein (TIGR00661 family)